MNRELVKKLIALQQGAVLGNMSKSQRRKVVAAAEFHTLKAKIPGHVYFNSTEIEYLKEHLDLLAKMNLRSLLELLKEDGANLIQRYNNQTLLDIAEENGDFLELARWLENIGVTRADKLQKEIRAVKAYVKADNLAELLKIKDWTPKLQLKYISVEPGRDKVFTHLFKDPTLFTPKNIFKSGNLPLLKEVMKRREEYPSHEKISLDDWIGAVNDANDELAAYALEQHLLVFNEADWRALWSKEKRPQVAAFVSLAVIKKILEKDPGLAGSLFIYAVINNNASLAVELMKSFPDYIPSSDYALLYAKRGASQYAALLVDEQLEPEDLEKLPRGWEEILASASMTRKEKVLAMATGISLWLNYAEVAPPDPVLATESPFGFELETYRDLLPFIHVMCEAERQNDYYLQRTMYFPWGDTVRPGQLLHKNYFEKIYAFKLSVLFGNADDALVYINTWAQHGSKQPLHDLCLFELPKNGAWDRKGWAALAMLQGSSALKFLSHAARIQHHLGRAPNTIRESKEAAIEAGYVRAKENVALAQICLDLGVAEKAFNTALHYMPQVIERGDNLLPDFHIEGKDLEGIEGAEKYYFMKLPAQDYRGFFLGELTNCCQSLGKAGERLAIHGMTSRNGGFYVLMRKQGEGKPDKIVAQSWAWISKDNAVVFDSWERLRVADDKFCEPFLKAAANEIIKQLDCESVAIGKGGHTPLGISFKPLSHAHQPADGGYAYGDSKFQLEVAVNHSLKLLNETTEKLEKLERSFLQDEKQEKSARFFEKAKGPGLTERKEAYLKVVKEALRGEALRDNHRRYLVSYAMKSSLLLTSSFFQKDPQKWIEGELSDVVHIHRVRPSVRPIR